MNPVHLTHKVLSTGDIVVIALYFCIVFAIGFYFSRKERTSADYFLAGRNVGWIAIGASLFVSNISTEHFIGLAGSGADRLLSGHAGGHGLLSGHAPGARRGSDTLAVRHGARHRVGQLTAPRWI